MKKFLGVLLACLLLTATVQAQTFKPTPTGELQLFVSEVYHSSDTLEITGTRYLYRPDATSDMLEALVGLTIVFDNNGVTTVFTLQYDNQVLWILAKSTPTELYHTDWDSYIDTYNSSYDYAFTIDDANLYDYEEEVLTLNQREILHSFLQGMAFENARFERLLEVRNK